jgi:hypothetical protein
MAEERADAKLNVSELVTEIAVKVWVRVSQSRCSQSSREAELEQSSVRSSGAVMRSLGYLEIAPSDVHRFWL